VKARNMKVNSTLHRQPELGRVDILHELQINFSTSKHPYELHF